MRIKQALKAIMQSMAYEYEFLIRAFLRDAPKELKVKNSAKRWNDIVFLFFINNRDSDMQRLSSLAYAIQNKDTADTCRIPLKHLIASFEIMTVEKESLEEWGYKAFLDYTIRDGNVYLNYKTLENILRTKASATLRENHKFIDDLYTIYEAYRRNQIREGKFNTHWLLIERIDSFTKSMQHVIKDIEQHPRVFKLLKGTEDILKKEIASSKTLQKQYNIIGDIQKSVLACCDIEIDIIHKFLQNVIAKKYKKKQIKEGTPPHRTKKNVGIDGQYIIIDEDEYSLDALRADIDSVRSMITNGEDHWTMDIYEASLASRHKMTLLNKIDMDLYIQTKDRDETFIDYKRSFLVKTDDNGNAFIVQKKRTGRARAQTDSSTDATPPKGRVRSQTADTESASTIEAKPKTRIERARSVSVAAVARSNQNSIAPIHMTDSIASLLSWASTPSEVSTRDSVDTVGDDIHELNFDELDELSEGYSS